MDERVRLNKYVYEVNQTLLKILDTMEDIREDQKVLKNDVHLLLCGEREETWYTQKEAAARLHLSPRTLRNWEARGKIKPHIVGGRPSYALSDIGRLEGEGTRRRSRR